MKTLADYERKHDRLQDECPVRATLAVIRGRWKPSILYELNDPPKRLCNLKLALRGIPAQALTVQLRQLEADGIISRTVYPEIPSRVEYAFTPLGEGLRVVLRLHPLAGARGYGRGDRRG